MPRGSRKILLGVFDAPPILALEVIAETKLFHGGGNKNSDAQGHHTQGSDVPDEK